MKFGIITHPNSKNIGDDIQSLAAFRLIDNVDYLLDRESLHVPISNENIKTINSGWFMENPENWPPSENIKPLFISMHITHNNNATNLMINQNHFNYYKNHEPIGCRDHHTVSLFESIGIKAYYSGCLTLTLKNRTKKEDKTEEIIFADPFNKNLNEDLRGKMFNKLVPDSIKKNIVTIEHSQDNLSKNMNLRLDNAADLLDRYSKAHLVVTSRIHVALPCVAVGTPVLFIDAGFNLKNSRNRFNGIIEYFNKIDNKMFPFTGINPISLLFRKMHLYNFYYNTDKIKFDWENPPINPIDITPIANKLRKTVNNFLKA